MCTPEWASRLHLLAELQRTELPGGMGKWKTLVVPYVFPYAFGWTVLYSLVSAAVFYFNKEVLTPWLPKSRYRNVLIGNMAVSRLPLVYPPRCSGPNASIYRSRLLTRRPPPSAP